MRFAGTPIAGFLALFLPAVIFISAAGYLFGTTEIRYQREQLEASDRASATLAASAVRRSLRHVTADVEFLSAQPDLRRAIGVSDDASLERLAEQFAAYIEAHGYFDQLRWIDERGMERVRVNNVNGTGVAVAAEGLQDKSRRGYFVEGMKMAAGSVYVSPLDLNIENDKIELPHKPMIRFAAPVYSAAGRHRGLVVINYLGRFLTADFHDAVGENAGRMMLLNRHGYWLSSPRPEDEFGFMFGRDTTLGARAPAVWAAIQQSYAGRAEDAEGVWTWESFFPLKEIEAGDQTGDLKLTIAGKYDYLWHAVMLLPRARIEALERRVWTKVGVNLGVLIAIAALVSAWLARNRAQIVSLNYQLAERAEAAEAASRAKASFLANMSHEIRTPMNAILGIVYLLERRDLPGDAAQQLHRIGQAGRSLLGIINDILDFSKIEAGHLQIEKRPFRLRDVLDNLSTIMAASSGDKDIELSIAEPPADVDQLQGDGLRLEQVLINLAGNAIKFTTHGHVGLAVTVVDADEREAALRFSVTDTGIGIAPETLEKIFAPFAQADTSTTRRFGGTGLGLAISRRLVELMGGTLEANSTPGQGSEFSFVVRFERLAASSVSAPEMAALKVLIADDSLIARTAIANLATAMGWTPTLADTGAAAVEAVIAARASGTPCDVIVLDWKMPEMDGLAAARAIRGAGDSAPEPIIVMVTAHAQGDLMSQPGAELVDAVLSKPVTTSGLYNAVARARQRRLGGVPEHVPAARRLAGLRLLVVDDSEINRDVAVEIFRGEGAEVSTANDGDLALAWLATHGDEVDAVLMDVQMPAMDGYEATRRLRAMPRLSGLPVIALTAGVFETQREAALAAGMVDFISKPFDVGDAVAIICRACGRPLTQAVAPGGAVESPPVEAVVPVPAGLNVKAGLALWHDEARYKQYLRVFVREYGDYAERIHEAEPTLRARSAHKLKGAAGNMALDAVAAAAAGIETAAADEADAALDRLRQAMAYAVAAIADYAGTADAASVPTSTVPEDAAAAAVALRRLLAALDKDDPAVVEPELAELARCVAEARLEPIKTAIAAFDFRGAESAARALAASLGLDLEAT